MTEDGRTQVKNFDPDSARAGLEEMLGQTGPRELHLITASGDLHVRITKKGKALISRSGRMTRKVDERQGHDRVKRQPLTAFDSAPLLKTLGIADADGNIRASMRGKYDQVNEFLRIIDATIATKPEKTLNIVDCGCGRAYLTLAVYFYLTIMRGFDVRVCGIDKQANVIATARAMADALDVSEHVTFVEGTLADSDVPFAPDMVLSLHACDTATDEALARGIEWKCRYLLRLLQNPHTATPDGLRAGRLVSEPSHRPARPGMTLRPTPRRLLHGTIPRPKRTGVLSHIPGCLSTPPDFCCILLPRNMLQCLHHP